MLKIGSEIIIIIFFFARQEIVQNKRKCVHLKTQSMNVYVRPTNHPNILNYIYMPGSFERYLMNDVFVYDAG